MNNNAAAIFRSLIVYAVCVPLAIFVGYTLTNPLDYSTLGFYGVIIMLMVMPILLRWHYPLLLLCWNMNILAFFLPSQPMIWLPMLAVSLTLSVLERIMSNEMHFIRVPQVTWPLVALMAVVFFTAEMTGGFGFRSLGGESIYGGKKYVYLIAGILSYFALTSRPIPPEKAQRYVAYFLLGGLAAFIGDLYPLVPAPLHFLFLLSPPSGYAENEQGEFEMAFGTTRLGGVAVSAIAVVTWMLAKYGLRGIFLSGKIWRPFLFLLFFGMIFLGGFRSMIVLVVLVVAVQFFLEGLHRSRLLLPSIFMVVTTVALLIPFARYLPQTFQRSLSILPLNIDPQIRMDAEGSSDWRLAIWKALLPEVPQHLLLGKGFGIQIETFNEVAGNSPFRAIDPGQDPLAISSDFHSGPLSLVLCLGLWGTIAWLWFWGASLRVMYLNYKYGSPELRNINRLFFGLFIVKCLIYIFIFGAVQNDIAVFASMIGLSVALNNGVCRPAPKPAPVSQPVTVARRFPAPRPVFQR